MIRPADRQTTRCERGNHEFGEDDHCRFCRTSKAWLLRQAKLLLQDNDYIVLPAPPT